MLVLTTGNGSSDAHVKVIDGTRVHAIDLRAGDATGTSLIGAHLVYHAISGEMVVVPVDDPESPSQLSDRRARLGMVSDHGILALASVDRPGSVCLENVIANVR